MPAPTATITSSRPTASSSPSVRLRSLRDAAHARNAGGVGRRQGRAAARHRVSRDGPATSTGRAMATGSTGASARRCSPPGPRTCSPMRRRRPWHRAQIDPPRAACRWRWRSPPTSPPHVALTGPASSPWRRPTAASSTTGHPVRGDRSRRSAGAGVAIPAGATSVDMAGKTIIPGLVDAHAHGPQGDDELVPQQNWSLYQNLASNDDDPRPVEPGERDLTAAELHGRAKSSDRASSRPARSSRGEVARRLCPHRQPRRRPPHVRRLKAQGGHTSRTTTSRAASSVSRWWRRRGPRTCRSSPKAAPCSAWT